MLTEREARDSYAGESAPQKLLLARMRSAASIVLGLARRVEQDAPDYAEYTESVKSAEIIVGDYLWQTGGYVKSDGVLDQTSSYGSLEQVKEAAVAALGPYSATTSTQARSVRIV